jgi:hypothetical protein
LITVVLVVSLACGGGSRQDAGDRFEVTVTGAFDVTLTPAQDRADFTYQPPPEGLADFPPAYSLRFARWDQSSGLGVTVIFYGAEAPASGTYEIRTRDEVEGSVVAIFSDRESLSAFGSDPDGTVTLRTEEGKYSGTFSFTVRDTRSDASVSVEGRFEDVPLDTSG